MSYTPTALSLYQIKILPCTTAYALFAECWGHSAKPCKHSAKALPSAALGKGLSAKTLSAKISLPSAKPALGKKITAVNI